MSKAWYIINSYSNYENKAKEQLLERIKLEKMEEIHFPRSLGLHYSAFTYFLGFKVNSGEYKLMGLAPYGNGNER